MRVLKWICFILVCSDTISYIVNGAKAIENETKMSSKLGRITVLPCGIAARVFVLYNTATCWLLT